MGVVFTGRSVSAATTGVGSVKKVVTLGRRPMRTKDASPDGIPAVARVTSGRPAAGSAPPAARNVWPDGSGVATRPVQVGRALLPGTRA